MNTRTETAPALVVGAWSLISLTATDAHGATRHLLGPGARGILIYTADGQMSAQVAGPAGYIGYAGSYQWLGDRVVHHTTVGSSAEWHGVELPRTVRWEEDRLVLRSLPDDSRPTLTATWRRARPVPAAAGPQQEDAP
ncbi:lipocalin-like domain-containing protein [Streptomyces sp. NPDC005876]|uniref:lipocalin-like domain-containing protein n=1 Tax=unclassified Streptomyces TaxID=2593676 RepID=UPI003402B47B